MPDELTIAALQTLSDLKRTGVIPTIRPCCGRDYCQCADAPQPVSLRDHARDRDEYDRALDTAAPSLRLRVVTAGPPTLGPPCDGTMTCPCIACAADRMSRPALGAGPAAFAVVRRRAA